MTDSFTSQAQAMLDRVDRMQQRSMNFGGAGSAPLTPRGYQTEAIEAILHGYNEDDKRRLLLVLATGLGKTVVFSNLAAQMQTDTLIVAHRDELLDQAADKLLTVWPDAEVGKVKGKTDDRHAQVVVGSVQTLARQNRLDRIEPQRFGLCVIDEAHHAAAASYRTVLDALHPDCLVLGVTATPDRGDGVGLHDVFEDIVYERDMLWGIKAGYLSDLRGVLVELDVDFSAIRKTRGDYVDGDMGRALHDANAPAHVLKAWAEHAADRKTIIFTPTVDLSREMVATFDAAGIPSAHVDGNTPEYDRKRILGMYAAGEYRMVSNCAVLTEGFDDPSTDCIVIARPTTSRGLYTQMVGRGTRKYPGKDDCLVIDAVGVSRKQSLVTVATLVGRKMKPKPGEPVDGEGAALGLGGMSLREVAEEQEHLELEEGRIRTVEVDLFSKLDTGRLAWASAGDQRFVISIDKGYVALIPQGDTWRVVKRAAGTNPQGDRWPFHTIAEGVTLEMAQGVGEDYVRRHAADSMNLASKAAAWRKRPASEKSIEACRKWGILCPAEMTAGEASDLLGARIAARELRDFA